MFTLSPLRASLIALLVLSIGIKTAVRSRELYADDEAPAAQQAEKRELIAFFRHHGFQADEADNTTESPVIPVSAGECRLLVALASPQGWRRDVVRKLASPESQTFYIYNGARYQDQPVWSTLIDNYWHRLYHYMGITLPLSPVLGIVATPSCELSRMPWQEIASLQPGADLAP